MRWKLQRVPLYKSVVLAIFIGGSLAGVGCGPRTPSEPNDSGEAFDRLIAEHQEVIENFPEHPDSRHVLQALKKAVSGTREVTEQEATLLLINLSPDNAVGLYALTDYCDGSDEAACLDLCRQVQESWAGEAVSALAFEKVANHLENSSPEEFLAFCDSMIETSDVSKEARTAGLLRFRYFERQGRVKEASLDALRIVNRFPDWSERLGLLFDFTSVLDGAGFRLESDGIRTAYDKGALAGAFLERLETASLKESNPDSFSSYYWLQSPDLEALSQIPAGLTGTPGERCDYWIRVASVAFHQRSSRALLAACQTYEKELQEHAARIVRDTERTTELTSINEVFLEVLGEKLKISSLVGGALDSASRRAEIGALKQAVGILNGCQREILRANAERVSDEGEGTYYKALERLVTFCKAAGLHEGVTDAYSAFVEQYPRSPKSPKLLLELGDYYRDRMNLPSLAYETFERIKEVYPNTSEAEHSVLRIALRQYEEEEYEEAFFEIQSFIEQHQDSRLAPNAKFIFAIVESALGLVEEAENDMLKMAETYPQHPIASRALFWSASSRIGRQEYEGASRIFADLVDRFPESKEAARAKGMLSRLESMSQPTNK